MKLRPEKRVTSVNTHGFSSAHEFYLKESKVMKKPVK